MRRNPASIDYLFTAKNPNDFGARGGGGESQVVPHDRVALAHRTFERLTVDDVQLSPPILDRTHALQHSRRDRNTGETRSETTRDHFLRQPQITTTDTIVQH